MGKVCILPYLRKGLANNIVDCTGETKGQKRAVINVGLRMKALSVGNNDESKEYDSNFDIEGKPIELLGPADVKTLSKKAISRMSPTGDVRLNCAYRPFVEFYEEDLPWRYTALSASHKDFHSWMALIAVKTDEYKLAMRGSTKTAVLNLTEERYAEVFPSMSVLKDVAHVQIDTTDDSLEDELNKDKNYDAEKVEALVNKFLGENPDCGLSRILCPSKLDENTVYTVMLIPAYELGRLAGLGLDTSATDLSTCAWAEKMAEQASRNEGMTFPMYAKWNITTANSKATFNTLANKLVHTSKKEYSEMSAYLDVDISKTGLQSVVVEDGTTIDVPASLTIDPEPTNLREEGGEYRHALKETLKLNSVLSENESGKIDMESDPWIVPPIYGARHKLTTQVEFETGMTSIDGGNAADYNIVNDVNLLLKNRIAAGMGSQIVKKNQEEFVNRAWKKVEVVNALNQLIREYYQMNQVNELSKERNPRAEVLKNKKLINKKNIGLLQDAAIKMLQSSGIYYNNVAPDTLIKEATAMNKQENPVIKHGLSLDRLKEIYDQKLWQELLKEKLFQQILEKSKDPFNEETFAPYAYLKNILCIKWDQTKRPYFKLRGDAMLYINGKNIINENINDAWSTFCNITLTKDNDFEMTDYYNKLKNGTNKKLTFEKDNIIKNQLFGVDICPIFLTTNLGTGYIVPDNNIITKPMIVEYQDGPINSRRPSTRSLVIIPQSYFNSHERNARYSIDITLTDGSEYTLETAKQGDGTFRITTKDTSHSLINGLIAASTEEFNTKLYNEFLHAVEVCSPRRGWYNEKKDSSKGKKYTSPNAPYVQLIRRSSTIEISFKGKEHPWLIWDIDDSFTKRFFTYNRSNDDIKLEYGPYADAIQEILNLIKKYQQLLCQPTDVEINNLNIADFEVVNAANIFEEALKEQDNALVDNDALYKNLGEEHKKIVEYFGNANPAWLTEEKSTGVTPDIPDPDALAKNRIQEICEKYNITEYNQLEDNLCSKYPVMVYPDFLDPTFFYLRELSVNYVLPGAGELLKNTVSCFYSNPAFEESLLMGMNTEMGHELLWREYPTDQRGSYFRKFWDQTTLPTKENLNQYYDVKPVHLWDKTLGNNHMAGKEQMLVFAVKGELMQAFPDTAIYLCENKKNALGDKTIEASMTSWLTDDTYLVGFMGVKKEDLKNYFLVFEQMPMSLQFTDEKEKNQINDTYYVVNPCIFALPAGK